jgi:hypothetical protein
MSYNFNLHYKCGNKKFHNIFQAFEHQRQTEHFPELILDQELVDNISNRKKPKDISPKAIRQLIVDRLKVLRKNYTKLKLAYSGGTDSYTILKLCVDNDIYIDETITIMSSLYGSTRVDLEYLAGLKLAKQYEGSKIGKCVQIKPTGQDLLHVNDPDWFLDERYVRGSYVPYRPYWLGQIIKQNVAAGDTIVITGYEKPKLVIHNKTPNWFIDDSAGELMGIENTVPLFLDKQNPDLILALAYATLKFKTDNKEGSYFGFHTCDNKTKLEMLEAFGFEKTPHNFVNIGKLGKNRFHFNTKTRYFLKELETNGHNDYVEKLFETHRIIKDRYSDLPHAVEFDGKFTKPIGRLSLKIPILQDKFGG